MLRHKTDKRKIVLNKMFLKLIYWLNLVVMFYKKRVRRFVFLANVVFCKSRSNKDLDMNAYQLAKCSNSVAWFSLDFSHLGGIVSG